MLNAVAFHLLRFSLCEKPQRVKPQLATTSRNSLTHKILIKPYIDSAHILG